MLALCLSLVLATVLPSDAEALRAAQEKMKNAAITGLVIGLYDASGPRIVVAGSVKPDSVLEIGSATKALTGALLAEMVERGEVKLEDPIAKYLPAEVKAPSKDGRAITLLDLATHSSGLPRLPANLTPKDPHNPYLGYGEPELFAFLSSYLLPRAPGAEFEYSNLGMGLLGQLLARKAGMTYEQLLRARILGPLGMRETAIGLSEPLRARFAQGHDAQGAAVGGWDLDVLAGAGGVRSTAADMLRLIAAALSGKEPAAAALRAAQKPRRAAGGGHRIGLAWHFIEKGEHAIAWHNGMTGGYSSFIGVDTKAGAGVVVLSASAVNVDDLAMHLLDPAVPIAPAPVERKSIELPAALLDGYIGRYQLAPEFFIEVTREGGSLFIQATNQPRLPVFAEAKDKFFLKVVDAQLTFESEAGKVKGLILHQNGGHMPGRKLP